jgi:hypothetical protein
MPNELIRDMNLSLKSKALLSLMLSLPDDWDYSVAGLTKLVKEGYDSVDTGLKELIRYNYIFREGSRKERGHFKYIYHIFENPRENYFISRNQPVGEKRVAVKRIAANPEQQIKDNKKDIKDKYDKTQNEKIEHNVLTKELIKLNYLSSDDEFSSFNFDNLFHKYLSEGKSYLELFTSIHYIVSRVKGNNYTDEDGNEIKNRYSYFKNAIESNFERLDNQTDEIWSEAELTKMLEEFKIKKKEEGDLYR